ncbi:multifunctional CCA addition/repair protein [Methylococcus capsulatus]|uniref:Multifunctional CCA protein n=1 Tax=Methylococcus capsulatus (strain ATCC 33009 / NCIMB 11132 / Bath) TaxID=243233 RepID=CCA_METCA|nr:multifunctional CCA addition/repair protein [Methylococcus capsulatus]Q60CQ4.1 RecName: Full=Multifunctional CCA protein; Includes: RecName: Full=CCA-adding enzyme; AltName: Full=CCA tRNA nucleotidyltransferase; AltName: Full=tRNA CCA-pyrophosphorylase; AltName: Full=tRNA adenylyl-/cytidylyl-transferase; AltName: Full=tRNA nucleotidyltransferase; AltName: Full=tRNA-NT; Includes: RecName: Full=2'-nucleotidase; Includes: RecName: Full=2',3'-cyclic phosphodiesterase; Includes: RecName: Full=Phosph
MKAFLVGGAVRDRLLGLPVRERDWVVVGESPETMIARGFRPVGRDFPVFLHPETHEEYALARTERKTAPGYRGFVVHAAPDVTLEQDLERRDLTINAMAETPDGRLVDPFGGRRDLEARLLRHVSSAFAEDPVRILRVARFTARLTPLGFRVAPETLVEMRRMVEAGEVDALVPERVWAEFAKALAEPAPSAFFRTLRDCGALKRLFPEIERLFGVPQPPRHHPEIDTGVHTLMVLDQAARLTADPSARFAALTHDLGKALTPPELWPSHRGHERLGLGALNTLCDRFRAPNAFRRLAEKVMRYHGLCHRAAELRTSTLVDLLDRLGALKRHDDTLEPFLLACEADARGRAGFEERPYPQADWLREAQRAAVSVDSRPLIEQRLQGPAFGRALRQLRIAAVRRLRAARSPATPAGRLPHPQGEGE